MQELVVLGLIPGTDIYIPFYFWLVAVMVVGGLFVIRHRILRAAYKTTAFLLAKRVDHTLQQKRLS